MDAKGFAPTCCELVFVWSTCSRHVVDNPIVACAGTGIHNPATNNDSRDSNHNDVNTGLSCSANDHMSNSSGPDIHLAKVSIACMEHDKGDGDGHIDIPTAIDNDVNLAKFVSVNDPMSNSSGPDIHLAEVAVACMDIDKGDGDGHIDIPTAIDNDVNLAKSVSVNDPMPNDVYEGNVVSAKEGRLDVLIQVVGHFMEFEESLPTVSLDDINVDEQEEKLVDTVKVESNKSEYVNVVTDDYKPCLASVFAQVKKKRKKSDIKTNYVLRSVKERKKRLAMALESPFGQQPPTTPVPPKFISRSVNCDFILPPDFEEDVSGQPKMRSINELMTMEVFVEQLSRPQNCKKDKVSMPDGLAEYLQMEDPPNYRFPWGYRDITVDREFCTLIYGWISCGVLDNPTQIGPWYPVAWRDVEKVYFPVNEPKRHWCLAELHITTRLVTFYDSLGWVSSNRKHWWQNMKRTLPQQLTLYLNEHGVLQSKGIAVERYEITYKFPTVIEQAGLYGDCGIWVCIFLYRLSRNLPLPVNEPLQTALAYRERILQYFWTHKIEAKKSLILNQGTYQIIM
ncbi:phospholipase-like protein [Tanacetum coccineum]